VTRAHEAIRVRDDRDWRALWRDVLARSRCSPDVLPMNVLCWALEQLALAGYELPRVLLFIQTIWSRFARTLGAQKQRIAPSTAAPASPPPPPPGASRRERDEYQRELEKQIADAQEELAQSRADYAHLCELVNVARAAFGDAQGFLVNALGWALQVLYGRGYSDDELGGLVVETWGVVEQQQRERSSSSSRGGRLDFSIRLEDYRRVFGCNVHGWDGSQGKACPICEADEANELERATARRTRKAAPRDGVACPFCGWSDPVQGARQGCPNCARWAAASETSAQARVTPRTRRKG
jgi:hypothetical protein